MQIKNYITRLLFLFTMVWMSTLSVSGQLPDPPSITCPANISVAAPAGECGAIVNYAQPVFTTTAPCVSPTSIPGYTLLGTHNNHAYFLSNDPLLWHDANLAAIGAGGNLVSISDAAENAFVRMAAIQAGSVWIGLTDEGHEGIYTWTTGEPFVYSNWYPGEPNNAFGIEHYIHMYNDGRWNDWVSYESQRYVVEFNCVGFVQTSGLPSGSLFPVGITTNTFSYSDQNGSVASCSFTVTILDNEAPVITCPGNLTLANEPGICGATVTLEKPHAEDNCFNPNSITTTFAGGNYHYGSMFDVVALNPIKIKNFIGHIKNGYHQIDFYYKTGTHVGFEHNPGAWTFLGSTWVNGYEAPAQIPFDVNINVEAGQTVSFFIAGSGAFNYTNGSSVGAIAAQNDDVKILIGKTRMEWTEGSSLFQPRIWNGTMNYESGHVTVIQIAGPPSGGLFPSGANTVVWQATDLSGNSTTCIQTVHITYDSVSYTVGTGGDFPTLTGEGGLFQHMNSLTENPVTYAIIISDISEPGIYALNEISTIFNCIDYILHIRPDGETLRTLSGNTAQAMIRFNGADKVFIQGGPDLPGYPGFYRYLAFRNCNTSQPVFLLQNGAQSNRITSCYFEGANSNAGSGVFEIGTSNGPSGNSNNYFFSNLFTNCPGANTLPSNLLYSSGTVGAPNSDNAFRFNEFSNFEQKGIVVTPVGNGSNWYFETNSVFANGAPATNANKTFVDFQPGAASVGNMFAGTALGGTERYCGGGAFTVSGSGTLIGFKVNAGDCIIGNGQTQNINLTNTGVCNFTGIDIVGGNANYTYSVFRNITVAGTGTVFGVNASGTGFAEISRNLISNVSFTKTTGSPVFKGIQLKKGTAWHNTVREIFATQTNQTPVFYGIANVGAGLTTPNQIFNNMVAITAGASNKPKVYGLFDQSVGIGANFYHNTVHLSGITAIGYSTAAFYRIGNGVVNVYNNILVNTRMSNSLAKHYAIVTNSAAFWSSNYNDLYTVSSSLGMWAGSNFNTLAIWKLMTGQDANSINVAPVFVSPLDLHLTPANTGIDNKGTPMFSTTFDIDWDVRNPSVPDMGADEFGTEPLRIEPAFSQNTTSETNGNSLSVYPNPFSTSNTISIQLSADDYIRVEMYNMTGSLIRVVAEGQFTAGTHTFAFDANDLPAGTYLCRYVVNGMESIVKRVERVK